MISSFKSRFAEHSAVSLRVLRLFAFRAPWPQVLHGNDHHDHHDHYDYDNDDHNNNPGTSLHSLLLRIPCSKRPSLFRLDLDLDTYRFVLLAALFQDAAAGDRCFSAVRWAMQHGQLLSGSIGVGRSRPHK